MNTGIMLELSNRIREHYIVQNARGALKIMLKDNVTNISLGFLIFILALGLVGPMITPYDYDETQYTDDGEIIRTSAPSMAHPLGTDDVGRDVLSRLMYGAQPTVITGLLGGTLIITIGATVGVTAGYVGGRVEDALMRFTDMMYSIPLIPLALVLVALMEIGFLQTIFVLGFILWRGSARVLRSQVLQIKERPYVLAAKSTGASTPHIIFRHIVPNIASMAIFFFALGIGYTIITQAGLAFIGVTNPFIPSWGIMLRNAYQSGQMAEAWWWSLPPGFLISFTVAAAILFGRGYEDVTGNNADEALVEAG